MKAKTASMSPSMDDYQVQSDVRTLTEAEKIKADKGRHKKAKEHAKKMLQDMRTVANGGEENETGENDNDADDKK